MGRVALVDVHVFLLELVELCVVEVAPVQEFKRLAAEVAVVANAGVLVILVEKDLALRRVFGIRHYAVCPLAFVVEILAAETFFQL